MTIAPTLARLCTIALSRINGMSSDVNWFASVGIDERIATRTTASSAHRDREDRAGTEAVLVCGDAAAGELDGADRRRRERDTNSLRRFERILQRSLGSHYASMNDNPKPTKAVILARGLGTRMRAASPVRLAPAQAAVAETGTKTMIPMASGRPFVDYVMSALADAGIVDVCLVVGPEHTVVRDRFAARDLSRLRVHFAVQAQPRGTADAILAAETFVEGDSFLALNSDNYYPASVLEELRRQPAPALPIFDRELLIGEAGIPRERIARYALLVIAADGTLQRIVEKPNDREARAMETALVSMNCWHFTPEIFEACRRVRPSARGELELPLAVQLAIDEMGARFTTFRATAPILDLSHREDIAAVAARLEAIEVCL